MKMVDKVKRKIEYKKARKMGFSDYFARTHFQKLQMDFEEAGEENRAEVEEFHKHGFYYRSLTRHNNDLLRTKDFDRYLSQWDYIRLHPLNGQFSFWLDDKITFRHMFSRYKKYIPDYYYFIDNKGLIFEEVDLPKEFKGYKNKYKSIMDCLKDRGAMVWKERAGTARVGLVIAEYKDGKYFMNGEEATEKEVYKTLRELRDYVLQEFIPPCSAYKDYFTTIRVIMIHEPEQDPVYCLCLLYNSGAKTNSDDHHGLIDKETGIAQIINGDEEFEANVEVPHWKEMVELCDDIASSYPELCYMGIDIGLAKDGFCMFEINSLPDDQDDLPYLDPDSPTCEFFKKRLKKFDKVYSLNQPNSILR